MRTLERRWGSKIRKRGHYRDSALSSRERSVSSPGLRWIGMAVVVTLTWTKQRWVLPFLCVLATTPEVSERLGKWHKTVGKWAHQMMNLVRRWLPSLEQVLQNSETVWQKLTLLWYGQGKRTLEICTGTALWYRYGSDPLPIRWILTRDPSGKHPPQAIFSTNPIQTEEQIIKDAHETLEPGSDF